jgi:protein-tyrosine phosphatase
MVTPRRELSLEGAFNVRDLGGYPTADGRRTRWRRLYRSGHLHRLTERDIDQVHELGIRTVLDLRSDEELSWTGVGRLYERGVIRHHHLPFFRSTTAYNGTDPDEIAARRKLWLARGYERMLETAAPAIAALFATLAEEDRYPIVFHCAAGKDRTGVLAALILRVLNVPDEAVVADYALTAEHRPAPDVLRQMMADYGNDLAERPIDEIWQAPAEVMAATLRGIDERYGSTFGYLAVIGVSESHIDAIRSILREPADR